MHEALLGGAGVVLEAAAELEVVAGAAIAELAVLVDDDVGGGGAHAVEARELALGVVEDGHDIVLGLRVLLDAVGGVGRAAPDGVELHALGAELLHELAGAAFTAPGDVALLADPDEDDGVLALVVLE